MNKGFLLLMLLTIGFGVVIILTQVLIMIIEDVVEKIVERREK